MTKFASLPTIRYNKVVKEQEKPISPTQEEVLARALSSPRMRKLSKEKGIEIPIPYVIQLPENQPYLTEIDCLGLSTRVRNALLRSGVREIALLPPVISGEQRVRKIGEKSREEIKQSLEDFRQLLREKWAENPGKPVIIEVSLPPPSEKQKKQTITERQASIVNWVKAWQAEHPGKQGAQSAAAEHFKITRERVRQFITKHQQLTGESLKPEGAVSLYEIARQIGVKPKVLFRLLEEGKITFSKNIDPFLTKDDIPYGKRLQKRIIPLSSVNIEGIRNHLTESAEGIMKSLTRSKARINKDILPLSKIIREVKPEFDNRQVRALYEKLVALGFHITVFPAGKKGCFSYFVHRQEVPEIIRFLKEKKLVWKSHKNKTEIVFGPSESPIPSTMQLKSKEHGFISIYKATLRVLERTYNPQFLQEILKIIFTEEQPSFPVYRYPRRHGNYWKIRLEDLSAFETLLKAKKEEIIRFLENPKDYSTSRVQS